MNVIYICRVSDYQVLGNQIDISKKVAVDFFNVPEDSIEQGKNVGINICHSTNLRLFEVIDLQPATNMRWSTKLNSFLAKNNDPLSIGCLLLFEKLGRSFCVHTITDTDAKYETLVDLFEENENHMLLSASIAAERSLKKSKLIETLSRQQIYYGAPGTGKSHEINRLTKGESVIRTTFHPDSDYSTFVGAYKPTMGKGKVYGAQGPLTENNKPVEEPKITYQFVMQAFLKAYLGAWKKYSEAETDNVEPQFLVVEEINRGNCAQIFGDLFQLLDRGNNGFSEYPIEADTDLQQEIGRAFDEHKDYMLSKDIDVEGVLKDYTSNYGATLSEDIQSGRILLLPSNLYIWATMNTSDQSLFPIDSAFKRRWEWKYVKIAEGRDSETKELLNWVVKFDYVEDDKPYTFECSWWEFVKAINEKIAAATSSDDKKLGYFFCKPKTQDSKEIDAERFVGKVVFYLWNDVFKDEENAIFKVVDGKGDPSFDAFYTEDDKGKTIADTKSLRAFMHNVFGDQSELYTETAKDSIESTETE